MPCQRHPHESPSVLMGTATPPTVLVLSLPRWVSRHAVVGESRAAQQFLTANDEHAVAPSLAQALQPALPHPPPPFHASRLLRAAYHSHCRPLAVVMSRQVNDHALAIPATCSGQWDVLLVPLVPPGRHKELVAEVSVPAPEAALQLRNSHRHGHAGLRIWTMLAPPRVTLHRTTRTLPVTRLHGPMKTRTSVPLARTRQC